MSFEQDSQTDYTVGLIYILKSTVLCTDWSSLSLTSGSNLGPPGIAMLSALAVKKDLRSNR